MNLCTNLDLSICWFEFLIIARRRRIWQEDNVSEAARDRVWRIVAQTARHYTRRHYGESFAQNWQALVAWHLLGRLHALRGSSGAAFQAALRRNQKTTRISHNRHLQCENEQLLYFFINFNVKFLNFLYSVDVDREQWRKAFKLVPSILARVLEGIRIP